MNCAFDDTSMSFGIQLGDALSFRAISDFSCDNNGNHFPKWLPPSSIFLPLSQVLERLGSWFWWLTLHCEGWGMQWYYLQHASNYLVLSRIHGINNINNISSENTVHHSGKGQCTEVLRWHICTVLCTPFYIHSGGVCDRPWPLLIVWSSELPIHLCPSSSTPSHLEMGWRPVASLVLKGVLGGSFCN